MCDGGSLNRVHVYHWQLKLTKRVCTVAGYIQGGLTGDAQLSEIFIPAQMGFLCHPNETTSGHNQWLGSC